MSLSSFTSVIFLVSYLFLLMPTPGVAQKKETYCATRSSVPGQLRVHRQATEASSAAQAVLVSQELIYIPVAFHVVRKDDSSADVTDTQINNQVAKLNEGFSTTRFRFFLYSTDRTNNTAWCTAEAGSQQEIDMKQTLAIDPEHVLNVYTGIPPLARGYAWYPWDFIESSTRHGVVVNYGTLPGGSYAGYNLGAVTVHEVGHYMGLYHTFENGCNPPGDHVADTPYQSGWREDCEPFDSCPESIGLDPLNNYMNYAPDACLNEFTPGQSTRMDEQMTALRPSILAGVLIAATQKSEDQSELTGTVVGRWEGASFTNYAVPFSFRQLSGTSFKVRALQDLVQNPTEKYNRWNSLTDVVNHRDFVSGSVTQITGNFKGAKDATLSCWLLDTGSQDGSLELRDPWFIDSTDSYGPLNRGQANAIWWPRGSLFTPNTNPSGSGSEYKGVFLNQDPQQGSPAWYSARVLQPQLINGFDWYFYRWVGSGANPTTPTSSETPVVFTSSSNPTVTAQLKAHLGSNHAAPTQGIGQRRIVNKPDGSEYLICYESAGEIWSSLKSGSGDWQPEKRVSAGNGGNSKPSIATTTTKQAAVWQRSNGSNYDVYLSNRISGSWSVTPILVGTASGTEARPVVSFAVINEILYTHVAFKESDNNIRVKASTNNGSTWAENTIFSHSMPVYDPSLSPPNYEALVLSYERDKKIYSRKYAGSWSSEFLVPASGSTQYLAMTLTNNHSQKAQVTRGFERNHYVWYQFQIYDGDVDAHFVVHQDQFEGGVWSTVKAYQTNGAMTPTVTRRGTNRIWMWSDGSTVYRTTTTNGTWPDSPTSLGSGYDPALSTSNLSTSNDDGATEYRYITRQNTATLKKIAPVSSPQQQKGGEQEIPKYRYARTVAILDADMNPVHAVTVEQPKIGEKLLPFVFVNDTLPDIHSSNWSHYLSTEPVEVGEGESLRLVLWSTTTPTWKEDPILLQVSLRDDATGAQLLNLTEAVETIQRPGGETRIIDVPVGEYSGKNVRLEIRGDPMEESSNYHYLLAHVHLLEPKELPLKLALSEGMREQLEPTEFRLHQNYPNPFNPTTTIAFDVPEAAFVSLRVYNMLGEEVMTLVDEIKSRGRHSRQVDFSRLPSGVYLYRLKAGIFNQARQLVPVK